MQDLQKLFIVGLDGATFDVIFPLVEEGYMPNLERAMQRAAFARLASVIPPLTPHGKGIILLRKIPLTFSAPGCNLPVKQLPYHPGLDHVTGGAVKPDD